MKARRRRNHSVRWLFLDGSLGPREGAAPLVVSAAIVEDPDGKDCHMLIRELAPMMAGATWLEERARRASSGTRQCEATRLRGQVDL